jgi:hypothetical protein
MRLIANTPRGVYKGEETEYSEKDYKLLSLWLESIHNLEYLSFATPYGEIYMTQEMINQSVIVLEK